MSSQGVDIQVLPEGADLRGSSYALTPELTEFLGRIADVHVMTIRPGHERGDHYHEGKREVLIVHYWDHWEFDWDDGADARRRTVEIAGDGAAMIRIPAGCWHRVRNDGHADLTLVGLSDQPYDPDAPDAHARGE